MRTRPEEKWAVGEIGGGYKYKLEMVLIFSVINILWLLFLTSDLAGKTHVCLPIATAGLAMPTHLRQ